MTMTVNLRGNRSSLPVRGAWIEMPYCAISVLIKSSLPVRGAWIEIIHLNASRRRMNVAPRAGSVD